MASFCRSAIVTGSRSLAARSKALAQKTLNQKPMSSPFSSPTMRAIPNASRVVSVLGSVDSLLPFHSATANARLKSSIAVDSSCWSWLSQGISVWRGVLGNITGWISWGSYIIWGERALIVDVSLICYCPLGL